MKKILLALLLVVAAGLIVIQFFQPEKNNAPVTTSSIFFQMEVPGLTKKNLVSSCFDCHSEQTRYPWYGSVAPVSWILDDHITEGKEHLNFSRWSDYSPKEQVKLLGEICEVVEEGSMPLKSYVFLHPSAKLLPYQAEDLCDWAGRTARNLSVNE